MNGEVIGITTMKVAAADGISFAIPIDTVAEIAEQLRAYGRVRRAFVGMKVACLRFFF